MKRTSATWPAMVVIAALGCGSAGPYVWARDLKAEEVGTSDYVIVVGDVLSVRVFNQDPMSTHAKVRSDGKISMPFLGDVTVQGKSPTAIARQMEAGLASLIKSPNVTVIVDEFQPTTVTVVGEVGKPGTIAIERNGGVLQAIASVGGLTDNANRDDIFVLRETPVPRRIRFTYDSLVQFPPAQTFRLRAGDVVVVE